MNDTPAAASPQVSLSKRDLYSNPDNRPKMLAVDFAGIPEELRRENRWVLWRLVLKKGRWTKVPLRCSGRPASSTDSATWTSFEAVEKAYKRGGFDGIGFVLGDGWSGVDLDNVRDLNRNPSTTPEAFDLIQTFNGYSEVSPSGTGYKIIGRGKWNGDWHKKAFGTEGAEVEVYDSARYFCVTGICSGLTVGVKKCVTGADVTFLDIQPLLNELEQRYREDHRVDEAELVTDLDDVELSNPQLLSEGNSEAEGSHTLTDDEIIARAHRAKNGTKFASLWNGNADAYGGDESRADLALCRMLAFWTGNDAKRLDNLFRRSKLLRNKWDEKRGELTYGQRTLAMVLKDLKEVYTPPQPRTRFNPTTVTSAQQKPPNDSKGPQTAAEIILNYFRGRYRPVFRAGNLIHTEDAETVPMGVATAVPTSAIILKLASASNVPMFPGGGVKTEALPTFFKRWASTAWGDLLDSLPDEHAADLGVDSPTAETFRRLVKDALLAGVMLGDVIGHTGVTQVERRSLFSWCKRFSKNKGARWAAVRDYPIWFREVEVKGGEIVLQIAVRHELFAQLKADKRLTEMTATMWAQLAAKYGVGKSTEENRPHGRKAVVLDASFTAELNAATPEHNDGDFAPPPEMATPSSRGGQ